MSNVVKTYDNFVIDSIDRVTGFRIATKENLFVLEDVKDGNLENAGEKVFGTGKAGVRISALSRNKSSKFSVNNGFMVGGLIAVQTGTEAEISDSETILMPQFEYLELKTASPTTIETTFAASGLLGKEIPWIYKSNKDGSTGEKFTQAAAASATEFAYDPATKLITLPTGVFAEGDIVIASYEYKSKGRKYVNRGDTFAEDCMIVMDILLRDICDNASVTHSKIVMPKAAVELNWGIQFGSEPAVHAFSCEALQDRCSIDRELWYWVIPEA